jgi:hypothetical protein
MLGLVLLVHYFDQSSKLFSGQPRKIWVYLLISYFGLCGALLSKNYLSGWNVLEQTRNFYGVLRVKHEYPNEPEKERITLVHGRIVHGSQYVAPQKRMLPTEYFSLDTGIGNLFRVFPKRQNRKIGIIGLGAGSIAAYGMPEDLIRYYEINPVVEEIAREYFTFLEKSRAKIEVVLGDARLSMERETPQHYDILILDAFSSDAIPVHLLTDEAFQLYLKHLNEGGVIAAHLSNRHLDLRPIVQGLAEKYGLEVRFFGWEEQRRRVQADWMILTKNERVHSHPFILQRAIEYKTPVSSPRIWTDDFSNLVEILK